MILSNTQEFIEKAIAIHGNKYDYSKSIYIGCKNKIIITCPNHGNFVQMPDNHLQGKGCPICGNYEIGNKNRLNVNVLIEKMKDIHNNRYGYGKVIYVNNNTKITILCPIHDEFEQLPANHLKGIGCPKCGRLKSDISRKYTLKELINKFIKIHYNKFDYSKVNYINSYTKVIIICPIHGEFEQTPNGHLSGKGCTKCKSEKLSNLYTLNINEFIEKAIQVHGNKYNYDKVNYIHGNTKVTIICPKHGEFEQTPSSHSQGAGCPRCNRSKGELAIEDIFKKHNIYFQPEYKIPEVVNEFEYDFYLPKLNLLIEFHGIQHYEPIEFFGGEDTLAYTRKNDEIKKYHAYKFRYRFIEFNYKQLKFLTKEQFEELVISTI